MKDIADACGASVPTVSYVLSGSKKRYVNAKLRAAILDCAKELGYTPVKRKEKAAAQPKIAVVLPQIENIFFRRMIIGIETELYAGGYIPVLFHSGDDPAREARILDMIAADSYSGFLLVPADRSRISEETLQRLKKPYVVAERPLPCEGEYDFFSMDNFDAGYLATQELIRAGHRHIGFIGWQTSALTLLDRRLGYARALEEANILYRPEYVCGCSFSEEDCHRVTRELLSSQRSVTALLFAYHVPGLGGVRYLREAGYRIPQDLSVFVIGDPSWVELSTPAFSHITLPSGGVGSMAAKALLHQMKEGRAHTRERIALKGELVRGGSVAAPAD